MFNPKTERIKALFNKDSEKIMQLERLLTNDTNIYIDYANIRPWANKLGWNIDIKRLKQFLDSFRNIKSIKFYDGTLVGDSLSEKFSKRAKIIFKNGYITKPVKIMKHSINCTSIKPNSSDLLEKFIKKCLLRLYKLENIEYLNTIFKEMNRGDIYYIEDRKCNFDVEISIDMLLSCEKSNVDTFVLWSADSDFYEPIRRLLQKGKKVVLFATARRVSSELNQLRKDGLIIYEIKKIRNFICYKRQII